MTRNALIQEMLKKVCHAEGNTRSLGRNDEDHEWLKK